MKSMKTVIVIVCVGVVVLAGFGLFRFVQRMLISAASSVVQMGEAPLLTETDPEETWVVPTMPPEVFDQMDEGMNRVIDDSNTGADPSQAQDLGDTDDSLVPVDQTTDQLADTDAGQAGEVDQTLEGDGE